MKEADRSFTSLHIMKSAVYALMIRNLEERFIVNASSNRIKDLLRIFLEPIGHVFLWSMVKLFRYPEIDSGLDPALFILLGVLPWLFTYKTLSKAMNIIAKNKGLLCFKQIKLLDPVIALLLSELISMALVFCTGLLVLTLLEIDWYLKDPAFWLFTISLYFFTITGLAFLITCLGFFSKNLVNFFKLFLRSLYLFSGVFYSAQMISPNLAKYFTINPLFQFIELSRNAFSCSSDYPSTGLSYLFNSALLTMLVGLGVYMLLRKKIMTEIMSCL